MFNLDDLLKKLECERVAARSCWRCGVCNFARDLLLDAVSHFEGFDDFLNNVKEEGLEKVLLNGAKNWKEFSHDGNFFIYNESIAHSLCNPSELKRTKNGARRPNKNEDWLDVQARALYQAYLILKEIISC